MKKIIFIQALIIASLMLFGCQAKQSNVMISNDLIQDSESIDSAVIQTVSGSDESKEITDKSKIKSLVSLLDNIEVKELTESEEKQLFKEKKDWKEKANITITLSSTKENTGGVTGVKGLIVALEDGNLLFSDINTLEGDQRTISYLSIKNQSSIIEKIKELSY